MDVAAQTEQANDAIDNERPKGQFGDDIGDHLDATGLLPSESELYAGHDLSHATSSPSPPLQTVMAMNANLPPSQSRRSVGRT